jgi:hypothetical protein
MATDLLGSDLFGPEQRRNGLVGLTALRVSAGNIDQQP